MDGDKIHFSFILYLHALYRESRLQAVYAS